MIITNEFSEKKIYESKRENVKCSGHTVRNSETIITSLYICVIFIYVQKYVTATKFHTRTKTIFRNGNHII